MRSEGIVVRALELVGLGGILMGGKKVVALGVAGTASRFGATAGFRCIGGGCMGGNLKFSN